MRSREYRLMEALWWLIEKETCEARRRIHIDRLLHVAPAYFKSKNVDSLVLDRNNIKALVEEFRKTA